ncbi:MAG: hypothetical protein EB084_12065 [Proteobacteria bacterium]|nr:hypothetical protein [Pseudomonadota bacterium]
MAQLHNRDDLRTMYLKEHGCHPPPNEPGEPSQNHHHQASGHGNGAPTGNHEKAAWPPLPPGAMANLMKNDARNAKNLYNEMQSEKTFVQSGEWLH